MKAGIVVGTISAFVFYVSLSIQEKNKYMKSNT